MQILINTGAQHWIMNLILDKYFVFSLISCSSVVRRIGLIMLASLWEFVQENPMDAAPTELVESFGGSTGTSVMTAALAAVKLKGKLGNKFGKKKGDGE